GGASHRSAPSAPGSPAAITGGSRSEAAPSTNPMTELLSQIPIAFASGLISVLSPCVMPLMPAYLSLISGVSIRDLTEPVPSSRADGDVGAGGDAETAFAAARRAQRARVMEACLGFVCGFSLVFIVLGATAFALGRLLRSWHVEILGFELGL